MRLPRTIAAALTYQAAGRRRYKPMARFDPLSPDQLVYPNVPSRIAPHYSWLRAYLQKGAAACLIS
jgi:hypothetical protein